MTSSRTRPPVHESLTVRDFEDIYSSEEWRRSVVRYQYDDGEDYTEVAVYLWHLDDGKWTRKNKYVIKTVDAWQTDRQIVDHLFSGGSTSLPTNELPVSDYYNVAAGETVFRSDDWWKAIVKIDQKGSYDTDEIMIYLWQSVDGDWRRRQKFTIKSQEQWEEESALIDSVLGVDESTEAEGTLSEDQEETHASAETESVGEFEKLSREIDDHLSGTLQN